VTGGDVGVSTGGDVGTVTGVEFDASMGTFPAVPAAVSSQLLIVRPNAHSGPVMKYGQAAPVLYALLYE
jgi:hypothetical protein